MNLGLHIFNFLQEKGRVELPSFGIFILEKKSAQFDEATSTLLPPTQEIIFQKNNLVFGADLSRYIAEKTGGNLFEVQTQIKEEVLLWNQQLEENITLHVDELGDFAEKDGAIVLSSKNPNYFGLEEISLKEIENSNLSIAKEDTENQYVFSQSVLWSFLFIIPLGGVLFLALNYQEQIFGKKSFNVSVKTSTHRIENRSVKKDSIKKDTAKVHLKDSLKISK